LSSRNALKHGLFTRELVQTAAPLREDPAEFGALLADLHARYRPDGEEETLIVDCIAATWWRRQRLSRYMSRELTGRAQGGRLLLVCIEEAERFAPHEGRLERSLSRLRRDLALLQLYRLGRKPEWKLKEAGAAQSEAAVPAAVPTVAAPTALALREAEAVPEPECDAADASTPQGSVPLHGVERDRRASGEGEAQFGTPESPAAPAQ
jgi:hypothetical protein